MARCYANENFPLPAVDGLRHFGHDVLTTFESGRAGQAIPDVDVLAFATAEQRTVITLNRRHFIRLHYTTPAHAGIVVCTFDPRTPSGVVRGLRLISTGNSVPSLRRP